MFLWCWRRLWWSWYIMIILIIVIQGGWGRLQLPDDDVDVRELGGGISLSLQHVFLWFYEPYFSLSANCISEIPCIAPICTLLQLKQGAHMTFLIAQMCRCSFHYLLSKFHRVFFTIYKLNKMNWGPFFREFSGEWWVFFHNFAPKRVPLGSHFFQLWVPHDVFHYSVHCS